VNVVGAYHTYGGRIVLDNVYLDLRAGEIYGLLGPNGAGKTTLMRALCGRFRLDGGHVLVNGADPNRDSAARRGIGFVPQDIALFAHLSVRENLEVFGRFAGLQPGVLTERIELVMVLAGLTERGDQICGTLSGGYQRRVNICASILHRPSVLVLDEPTVGIDIDAREAVHGILQGLRAQGTAIMLTTHDLEQAEQLSDRVGIMIGGRLVVEGAPSALVNLHFSSTKEVVVTLSERPTAEVGATFSEMDVSQTQNPIVWSMRVAAEALEAGALARGLSEAGIRVKELRIREPDLASVFLDVVSRESQQ
jgi:ABC-2 type transport system ATP-binding protein